MIQTRQANTEAVQARWFLETPLTNLWLECTAEGVRRMLFCHNAPELSIDPISNRDFAARHAWARHLLHDLRAYFSGQRVEFVNYPIDLRGQPPFRRKVQEACRCVAYGTTTTYAALAAQVGNPAAVRAVGSAMRHNPLPLLVPCHRVLRSDGSIGGFAGPDGVTLKRRLLEMEHLATV